MKSVTVDQYGVLVLDEATFDVVGAKVQQIAPEYADRLTWNLFTARESWQLIPDVNRPDLPCYKAELTLVNEEPWERTIRINDWFEPDLRMGDKPWPHNHPWPFKAHVAKGGYRDVQYTIKGDDIRTVTKNHRAGDVNEVPLDCYHEVIEIFEPGQTFTVMDCGKGQKGAWGYYDLANKQHVPNVVSPEFMAMLRDRNPHLPG